MKRNANAVIVAITSASALAISIQLAAQEEHPRNTDKLPEYFVIDLGTLGGTISNALGINNKGWVTGWSMLSGDMVTHAFLWRKGVKTDLGTLGGPNSVPITNTSVNEEGELVGAAESSAQDPLGENFFLCGFADGLVCLPFLWQEGAMMSLSTLGGSNGLAFAINHRGDVVGAAENSTRDPTCVAPQVLQFKPVIWKQGEIQELPTVSGDPDGLAVGINDRGEAIGNSGDCALTPGHALFWHHGAVTDMGTLRGMALFPSEINNRGQVVGSTTSRAFLWQEGVVIDLGTLPGDGTSAGNAINDRGQVIGQSVDASFNRHAVIWRNGLIADLNKLVSNDSGLVLVDPNDINSRGEIVGLAVEKSTGELHAFLAIPCDSDHADREGASAERLARSVMTKGASDAGETEVNDVSCPSRGTITLH